MAPRPWQIFALAAAFAGCGAGAPGASDAPDAAAEPIDAPAARAPRPAEPDAATAVPPDAAPARDGAADATSADRTASPDAAPVADAAPAPAGATPVIMQVGYGGIRVVSRDGGKTWRKVAQLSVAGGDDQNLLRAVAWGNGTWVVAGWKLLTSPDGVTWTERKQASGCGLMEGLAFGNGTFVGTCGTSSFLSADGVTWTRGGSVGATTGHTYVLFANGGFAASGDSGNSYTSTDGKTWQAMPGVTKVAFCEGEFRSRTACAGTFWDGGVWLREQWRGKIQRSTDGRTWETVYSDDAMNSGYRFGVGLMKAE